MNVELGVNKHAVIPVWAEVAAAHYVFWLVIVLQTVQKLGAKVSALQMKSRPTLCKSMKPFLSQSGASISPSMARGHAARYRPFNPFNVRALWQG